MTADSKPAETPSTPNGTTKATLSAASVTCPSKSPSKTPPAGSTSKPVNRSGGDKKISDEAAAEALAKIGALSTPEALAAYKTVGRWQIQKGVAEVALASTHTNNDSINQALIAAHSILENNPDDVVKVRAAGAVAQLVRTRIANAELALRCAESVREAEASSQKRAMNPPPQFNVNLNVTPKEKPTIEV